MRHILLMATTLAASPAFGMEAATQESHKRTITVIADLDQTKSGKLNKRYDISEYFYRPYPGSFRSAPSGYTYDFDKHTISFSREIEDNNTADCKFDTRYCPSEVGDFNKESFYDHSFKYTIPAGNEDVEVHATLLSIKVDRPANVYGYFDRIKETIYENK